MPGDSPDLKWGLKRLTQLEKRMATPPFTKVQELRDAIGSVMQVLAFFDGWEENIARCEVLLAKLPPPKFGCAKCGGCCKHHLLIDLKPWEVPTFTGIPGLVRYRMDGPFGRTAVLDTITVRGQEQCLFFEKGHCGIYEDRPLTCRCFLVGGPGCRAIRDEKRMWG